MSHRAAGDDADGSCHWGRGGGGEWSEPLLQQRLGRQPAGRVQRSSAIANAQLQAGTIDIITSLNTQSTLFNDLDLLTQIRLSRFQALINLYKALGGGFQVGPNPVGPLP